MADPVIPGGIRATVTFQGASGLPEDRYVTSYAFRTPSGSVDELHHQQARDMLTDFWTLLSPGGNNVLHYYLANGIVRGPGAMEIRSYDLGQTLPREPFISEVDLSAITASDDLPHEVALCASFAGERNLPRTRGRVYIGPLRTLAATSDPLTKDRRPEGGLMGTAIQAMQRLRNNFPRPEWITWCILSQTDATLVPVEQGWVDNAFDTQRRRGTAPTGRQSWTAAS